MTTNKDKKSDAQKKSEHPFRSAVIRGMGVVFPPLMTIVIFLWISGTVNQYVLRPVTAGLRNTVAWSINDTHDSLPPSAKQVTVEGQEHFIDEHKAYIRLDNGTFVPAEVYDLVAQHKNDQPIPRSSTTLYQRYVEIRYLQPHIVIPFFLSVFILILYLLGKLMAVGIGRFFWNLFEWGIRQLPVIRTVYSSVKQVSDFFFSPKELEYTRVVAIEYPRSGIWSLGLVTGESLLDISSAANEPVLSVLMCTSPAPMTGFTVTVRKSEAIDLNITVDQAFQFIISCGVVVPPHQMAELTDPKALPSEEKTSSHKPETTSEWP